MKYITWIYENILVWLGLAALAFFAFIGALVIVAAPHLRCGVVP